MNKRVASLLLAASTPVALAAFAAAFWPAAGGFMAGAVTALSLLIILADDKG